MDSTRKAALTAGLFYLATIVFSIPAVGLYSGVLDDPEWVLGSTGGNGVVWGGLIEVLTAVACIGTAVALYPVLVRYGPARAMGFVASRTLEAALILTGVLAVLSVATLQTGGGDPAALRTTAGGLVAVKDWTFLLGPGLAPVINAACLATILYRFRLVPRWMPALGLIGAPMLAVSSLTTLFGGWEQTSATALVMALPIAVWEFSVGVYMTFRGLRAPSFDDAPTVLTAPSESAALASV